MFRTGSPRWGGHADGVDYGPHFGIKFWNVFYTVTLYGKNTCALTFQNVRQALLPHTHRVWSGCFYFKVTNSLTSSVQWLYRPSLPLSLSLCLSLSPSLPLSPPVITRSAHGESVSQMVRNGQFYFIFYFFLIFVCIRWRVMGSFTCCGARRCIATSTTLLTLLPGLFRYT
jgi:hypothetical protein